jgi:hypothetical protein
MHVPELVTSRSAGPDDIVALAARLLAVHGTVALPDVLGLLADNAHADAVVVREPQAPGRIVAAFPRAPRSAGDLFVLDVPLRVAGRLLAVLTAYAPGPFGAADAAVLCGVSDVVALALAVAAVGSDPGQALLDAEADRADMAAQLHDTVGQALVAARYSADLALTGRADPQTVADGLHAAVELMRGCLRGLRGRAVNGRLGTVLTELAAECANRRAAGDSDAPVVRLRGADAPALDSLPPPVAVLGHRVVEAALAGVTGQVTVTVTVRSNRLKLAVEGAENPCDTGALDRWTRRASALGGELVRVWNGVRLDVPTTSAEERHDDGSHLR